MMLQVLTQSNVSCLQTAENSNYSLEYLKVKQCGSEIKQLSFLICQNNSLQLLLDAAVNCYKIKQLRYGISETLAKASKL